jgi:AcrR family transcriptional regulator
MPKVVPQYKEQARQRIIDGALKVFVEKGYDGATMESIAKCLGVSEGAIYLYFKNKRELFKAILEHGRNRVERVASLSYEAKEPFESFLKSIIDMVSESYDLSGLFLEFYSEAARDPQLKKIVRNDFDKDCETVENFLKELRKKRRIGSNADLRALSIGFIALSHGYVFQQALGIGKEEAKHAYVESAKAMIRGIP